MYNLYPYSTLKVIKAQQNMFYPLKQSLYVKWDLK